MKIQELFEDEVKQTSHGDEKRLSLPGGYLDYGDEDGSYILSMVKVEPASRNKGIATKLIKAFLNIVNGAGGYLTATTYIDDGEAAIKPLLAKLKSSYPKIEWDENIF